mmetsp:Transcript_14977/g.21830  ORF Transcript_14977/g.21830 Transcript_14977/m.21830 type:complete len:442 (+) Transcript_14977:63-1388(+)
MSWKGGNTRAVIQDLFGIHTHTVMLAATGMHVGKTTLSLGVFRGLQQKWGHGRVAYCKPLGQRYKDVLLPDGRTVKVDPDVETVRNFFKLDKFAWEHMSPVVFPPGFTRKVIDGRIHTADLLHKIKDAFTALATNSDFTLLEGSGHVGVGSIVNLNNAQVAGALGVDVVLIAPGGLGVSFDQLAMNKALLEKHGAQLRGVILNKVEPDKFDMVKDYYGRVLADLWETPLLGCIPYQPAIEKPSMSGYAQLLNSPFIAGESDRFRTFESIRLVLSEGEESVDKEGVPEQLVVTHSSRIDLIESLIRNHENLRKSSLGSADLRGGLIIVGPEAPKSEIIAKLEEVKVPTVFVKKEDLNKQGQNQISHNGSEPPQYTSTFEIVKAMNEFTQKHVADDIGRVESTMDHIAKHIDFDGLCAATPMGQALQRKAVRQLKRQARNFNL